MGRPSAAAWHGLTAEGRAATLGPHPRPHREVSPATGSGSGGPTHRYSGTWVRVGRMSDTPSGPGWWKAPDGRWYPTRSAAPDVVAPTQALPAVPGPPPAAMPPPGAVPPVGAVGAVPLVGVAGGVPPVGPPPVGPPPPGNPWQRFRATPPWLQALGWAIAAVVLLLIVLAAAGPHKPTQRLQVGGGTIPGSATTTSPTTASATTLPTTPSDLMTTVPAGAAAAPPPAPPATGGTMATTAATTGTTAAPAAVNPNVPRATTTAATTTTTSSTPVATPDLCGAPANPFGYNFCQRGQFIVQPDPATCQYFKPCAANFFEGDPNPNPNDYMVGCKDGTYSMSGGQPGACSGHPENVQLPVRSAS